MVQRIPPRWSHPSSAGNLHLLVETDDPALVLSDFSRFAEAGFVVALCTGPGRSVGPDDGDLPRPTRCPLVRQGRCELVRRADVVLHDLEAGLGIADRISERYPSKPVVCTDVCHPVPVEQQIRRLRAAACRLPTDRSHRRSPLRLGAG